MCRFLVACSKKNINPVVWKEAFKSVEHRGPNSSKVKLILL